ncbi:anaerobic sulfatase-maturation protein [Bacteroides sp. 51]|uniref:anaerobic sulfatase-maturation protein n=1 Tax=Bacteroides sp. 51 TaxID=2302938 RepID=UPI0013D82069|nr:anaerobic sulfatase-maturation protein [Bacteroides sp. 51]NDV81747.1 anaerobic sulfatase-maturation protein [Bacteroides sp. 51]
MSKTILFNPLSKPLYVMAKPVGAFCNLSCSYCYYLEKEKLYPGRKHTQMSDALLERYIEYYIHSQPIPEVMFAWHGGETLLAGIPFYRKVLLLQRKYGRGRNIVNTLQTNGVLLNDEWCRFFKDNNFLVGISLDGPEHCHDVYRKNRGGKGTFKDVMRGVELLQKYQVDFNILSVINDYNVQFPLDVYHFFKEIGAHYIQFSPIVERISHSRSDGLQLTPPHRSDDATLVQWTVGAKAFGQFYIRIFDEWVRNDVGQYFIQLFDATLANYVGEMPGTCIFGKTCGHASAMEFNGDVYACDHFVFPEYKLGNLFSNTFIEMMLSEKQQRFGNDKFDKLPRQCIECKFQRLCNGECPKNRIITDAYGNEGLNYLCEGYRSFFAHSLPYMEFMANELRFKRSPANVMYWARKG